MRMIGTIIGYLMWFGAGLLMFFFWITTMGEWLGFFGTILALVISPGLVVFPIVFWIVEKTFPMFYFIVWGIGFIGMFIAMFSSGD